MCRRLILLSAVMLAVPPVTAVYAHERFIRHDLKVPLHEGYFARQPNMLLGMQSDMLRIATVSCVLLLAFLVIFFPAEPRRFHRAAAAVGRLTGSSTAGAPPLGELSNGQAGPAASVPYHWGVGRRTVHPQSGFGVDVFRHERLARHAQLPARANIRSLLQIYPGFLSHPHAHPNGPPLGRSPSRGYLDLFVAVGLDGRG